MKIYKKNLSYLIDGVLEKPIKIPSKYYPLPGNIEMIYSENTEEFEHNEQTDIILQIYNSIDIQIGFCYQNIENLMHELKKHNINARSMVGWTFIGDAIPVHHCFAMIDNHILDYTPRIEFFLEFNQSADLEDARQKVVDKMLEARTKKNSEWTHFGKASQGTCHFAVEMDPQNGKLLHQKLVKAFPTHPTIRNLTDGMNETQKMYYDKMKTD